MNCVGILMKAVTAGCQTGPRNGEAFEHVVEIHAARENVSATATRKGGN